MKYLPQWQALALITCLTFAVGCGDDDTDGSGGTSTTEDAGALTDTATQDTATSDAGQADEDTGQTDQDTGQADTGGGGGGEGRVGLEGFCDHYVDCGGTYYEDADDCVAQTIDYWGECRRTELDTFGDCMTGLTCDDWGNPDAYNPSNTDCSDEWSEVQQASCD